MGIQRPNRNSRSVLLSWSDPRGISWGIKMDTVNAGSLLAPYLGGTICYIGMVKFLGVNGGLPVIAGGETSKYMNMGIGAICPLTHTTSLMGRHQ